jgi:hypothetical protein
MRKLIVLCAASALAALAVGVITTADAGRVSTDSNGNFLVIDVDVNPPLTSERGRPQGVTLNYHSFFGNAQSGATPPEVSGIELRAPRGFATNAAAFPECPLPQNNQQLSDDRCSDRSRVGRGTAVADARQAGAGFVPATIELFNGAERNNLPTLILKAEAMVGGTPVRTEIDFLIRSPRTRPTLDDLDPPDPATAGAPFSIQQLDLIVGRTVRVGTRRIPYLQTARTCPSRGWETTQTNTFQQGGSLTASDRQPCVG